MLRLQDGQDITRSLIDFIIDHNIIKPADLRQLLLSRPDTDLQ